MLCLTSEILSEADEILIVIGRFLRLIPLVFSRHQLSAFSPGPNLSVVCLSKNRKEKQ